MDKEDMSTDTHMDDTQSPDIATHDKIKNLWEGMGNVLSTLCETSELREVATLYWRTTDYRESICFQAWCIYITQDWQSETGRAHLDGNQLPLPALREKKLSVLIWPIMLPRTILSVLQWLYVAAGVGYDSARKIHQVWYMDVTTCRILI